MSVFTEVPEGGHPCNTCRALFSSIDKVKEHYRGDWHVFNSKRRAGGLAPLSKQEFKGIGGLGKGKKSSAPVSPTSPGKSAMVSSSTSPTAAASARDPSQVSLTWGGIKADTAEELRALATRMGVGAERMEGLVELALARQEKQIQARTARAMTVRRDAPHSTAPNASAREGGDGGSDEDEDEEEEEDDDDDEEEAAPQQPLGPNISIFDDKEFETAEECLKYMTLNFGFHIPDSEYLSDLEGFLSYLGEKVKLGGLCLYCQKQLRPGRPTQHHMISKGHCKVAYEEDVDLEEFEDFFDFTASYADLDVDENGEPIESTATVSPIGELILPDGRIAGHRAFRQYYKQYFAPQEEHPGVLALQREELLRLGMQVGGGSEQFDREDIVAMPDTQVMTLLVKYHKDIRRHNMLQQRAQQHVELMAKRRENRNRAQQQLKGINKTDKIRDYHGMLM